MADMRMIEAHPAALAGIDTDRLAECIAACFECTQICTGCADACLAEDTVAELTTRIRTDLDCADLCVTTGRVLTRRTGADARVTGAALDACATACEVCADECDRHARVHEHCRICAEVCRRCSHACRDLLGSLG